MSATSSLGAGPEPVAGRTLCKQSRPGVSRALNGNDNDMMNHDDDGNDKQLSSQAEGERGIMYCDEQTY